MCPRIKILTPASKPLMPPCLCENPCSKTDESPVAAPVRSDVHLRSAYSRRRFSLLELANPTTCVNLTDSVYNPQVLSPRRLLLTLLSLWSDKNGASVCVGIKSRGGSRGGTQTHLSPEVDPTVGRVPLIPEGT